MPERNEVERGLWAKMMMAQERAAITRTIGEIMDRRMRGAPIDAPDLYDAVGGKSEFTRLLFAETFGSKSMGIEGLISSDPEVETPMHEISEALARTARRLGEERVPNHTGLATGVRAVDLGKLGSLEEGDKYVCVKIGLVAGGGMTPWPGDPFIGGPSTWVFGSPTEAREEF